MAEGKDTSRSTEEPEQINRSGITGCLFVPMVDIRRWQRNAWTQRLTEFEVRRRWAQLVGPACRPSDSAT